MKRGSRVVTGRDEGKLATCITMAALQEVLFPRGKKCCKVLKAAPLEGESSATTLTSMNTT